MTDEEILTKTIGELPDHSLHGPRGPGCYRWAAIASLENGDVDRASVYARLAQSAAVDALASALS